MSQKKTTGRPVGRPPTGIPPRKRHNVNIQRDIEFDTNLATAQRRIAEIRGLPASSISQTEAIKLAVRFYTEVITINELPKCDHCNDTGHLSIQGDSDVPCPDCSEEMDTPN